MKDSLKNSSKIRDFEVWNNSVDFSFEDANSWFLLNDLTNVVFNNGLYIQDNGNVSSLSSNFQFIDEYVFKLKEFSKVTIDLTDVNGETLDDDGDAVADCASVGVGRVMKVHTAWDGAGAATVGDG